MILVLGDVSTHEACRRDPFKKPVFAANVVDTKLQGIPADKGRSGVQNLNYINTLRDLDREFQRFRRITPYSNVVIIVDDLIQTAIPQLNAMVNALANAFTLDMTVVGAKASAQEIVTRIPPETDAVFLGPTPRLSEDEFQKLAAHFIAHKRPSYTFQGEEDVKKGILMGTLSENHALHLARSVCRQYSGGPERNRSRSAAHRLCSG